MRIWAFLGYVLVHDPQPALMLQCLEMYFSLRFINKTVYESIFVQPGINNYFTNM